MRRSHDLLMNSDTSVSVIADTLGYSTPANFTKAFRERYGCSPTELRANRFKSSSMPER
jgi:AraC-like DNA-binding protein